MPRYTHYRNDDDDDDDDDDKDDDDQMIDDNHDNCVHQCLCHISRVKCQKTEHKNVNTSS